MRFLVPLAAAFAVATSRVITTPSSSPFLSPRAANLSSTFQWTSTPILISPKPDARNISGIKDPSIIFYKNTYHVFASTAVAAGYNLVYLNFTSFSEASTAPFYYLDQSPIGTGYRAAPQVFYFEPQKLWYLIYQNGNAAYSTNTDISNPAGWTAPKTFYTKQPSIIKDNIGDGYWVDMWVICDAEHCHLFSSDDNGHLYRSQTPLSDFPAKMNDPVIALSDARNALFEASNVYSLSNSSYLLLVEAIGSDGNRYFRSWTANSVSGPWTGLADSEANPFARASNVVFEGKAWTESISHGEMIRTVVDQRMRIGSCGLRYLYQGVDPKSTAEYNALPWRLGLLTQRDAAC